VNPDTGQCVEPTLDNVLTGTYAPLGRPLFIYPSAAALQRPEVLAFIDFYLENQEQLTTEALFIPMNDDQLAESQARVEELQGDA
jgi:phosphate transport system substrate-binding protein